MATKPADDGMSERERRFATARRLFADISWSERRDLLMHIMIEQREVLGAAKQTIKEVWDKLAAN
jgi:hypothetical protein